MDASLVYKVAARLLVAGQLENNQPVDRICADLKQLLTFVRSSSAAVHTTEVIEEDGGRRPDEMTESVSSTLSLLDRQLSDDIVTECIGLVDTVGSVLACSLTTHHQHQQLVGLDRQKLSELHESLIRLVADDTRRIEAYLNGGKRKLAYLLAVSIGDRASVRLVLDAARQANDQHYVRICEMWLVKNATDHH